MNMTQYDLYLDESGTFVENQKSRNAQGFASQLVGLLVPHGELKPEIAEQILRNSYEAAGYSHFPKNDVHGNNLAAGEQYDRLIDKLVTQIQQQKWQPVRLVNQEGINYGDRINNYVNMVAELALRIAQQKSQAKIAKIVLNFHCAIVYLGVDEIANPQFINEGDYLAALRYYFAFAAVRQGLAAESAQWKIGNFSLLSAKRKRILQICDLLSNASYDNYTKCGQITADVLKNAFGSYDQSMIVYLWAEKCDLLAKEGSLGLAIRTIAEQLVWDEREKNVKQQAEERLQQIIDKLANFAASSRNVQLTVLTSWLEQIINQQRSLDLGYKLAQWLHKKVNAPLSTQLKNSSYTLSWFSYTLHFWALTACNHRGDLVKARTEADELQKLMPALAGQWEYVTLLMEGLVAEAVHLTDCLEYDAVAQRMKLVATYYADVSSLFTDAFPQVFPARVRSDLRAKALGTWLQTEIYAGASEPKRLATARELSQECIAEFSTPGDKERQYQYRCQLETVAGDFATARKFLAASLKLDDVSHGAIAYAIVNLDVMAQGFALLHWLRLGTTAYLSADRSEWQQFEQSLQQSRLLNHPWCKGTQTDNYPTHGILWRVALINAIRREKDNAALARLRNLEPLKKGSMVLGAIMLAAYAEVAALMWDSDRNMAIRLLDCQQSDRLGLKQLLLVMLDKSRDLFPQVGELTQSWLEVINEVLIPNNANVDVPEQLLRLGRKISY